MTRSQSTPLVQVLGDRELREALLKMPIAVRKSMVRAPLMRGARVMRDAAKAAAPRGPTGNLRKDIRARWSKRNTLTAYVKSGARHAHLVEYGSAVPRGIDSKNWDRGARGMPLPIAGGIIRANVKAMPARPYFFPAVHQTRDIAMKVAAEGISKNIGGYWVKRR